MSGIYESINQSVCQVTLTLVNMSTIAQLGMREANHIEMYTLQGKYQ